MLAFTMQICSNTTERKQLEHNTNFAFAYQRFVCLQGILVNVEHCASLSRCGNILNAHTHIPQTGTSCLSSPRVCESHPSTHQVLQLFLLISDNSPAISQQQFTSCNSSGTHFHKQISSLSQIKGRIYCSSHVFLSHLKSVKLCHYFYLFIPFLSVPLMMFFSVLLHPHFPHKLCGCFCMILHSAASFRNTYVPGEIGVGKGQILIHSCTYYVKNVYFFFPHCNEKPSKYFKQRSNMI